MLHPRIISNITLLSIQTEKSQHEILKNHILLVLRQRLHGLVGKIHIQYLIAKVCPIDLISSKVRRCCCKFTSLHILRLYPLPANYPTDTPNEHVAYPKVIYKDASA